VKCYKLKDPAAFIRLLKSELTSAKGLAKIATFCGVKIPSGVFGAALYRPVGLFEW